MRAIKKDNKSIKVHHIRYNVKKIHVKWYYLYYILVNNKIN